MSTTTEEPTIIERFMQLDRIIRNAEEGIRLADNLKAQGRWKEKWNAALAKLRADLEKAKRERDWMDSAVARYQTANA